MAFAESPDPDDEGASAGGMPGSFGSSDFTPGGAAWKSGVDGWAPDGDPGGAEVFGIDSTPAMLGIAGTRGKENISFAGGMVGEPASDAFSLSKK
jgi:hypothetical protein